MEAGSELPEEIIRDILSRLPVRSLLRFRCVCKLWYALIKNPSFIALHLSRASSRKSNYLVVNRCPPDVRENVLTFYADIETLDDAFYMSVPVPAALEESNLYSSMSLSGTSNGLLCLTDMSNCVVLLNPATREFRALSMPQFTHPGPHWIAEIAAVGFGFDPETGDYKVVGVFELFNHHTHHSTITHVYNLSSDSWRPIETLPPADICLLRWSMTLFNGALHWFAVRGDDDDIVFIVSFHMSKEVFQPIPLPDSGTRQDGFIETLDVLNESLALIRLDDSGNRGGQVDIWVMKEYGVKGTWAWHCKIGPLMNVEVPLKIWENSELLLKTMDGQLVSCNLYDQNQNVKKHHIYEVSCGLGVAICSESLVSVTSGNVV